jgi:hypothetical protein
MDFKQTTKQFSLCFFINSPKDSTILLYQKLREMKDDDSKKYPNKANASPFLIFMFNLLPYSKIHYTIELVLKINFEIVVSNMN